MSDGASGVEMPGEARRRQVLDERVGEAGPRGGAGDGEARAVLADGARELAGRWGTRAVEEGRVRVVPEVELAGWLVEWAGAELAALGSEGSEGSDVEGAGEGRGRGGRRVPEVELLRGFLDWVGSEKGLDSVGVADVRVRRMLVDLLVRTGVRHVASGRYFTGLDWADEGRRIRPKG